MSSRIKFYQYSWYLLLLSVFTFTASTLYAQKVPQTYTGRIMGQTIFDLVPQGGASFAIRGFDGHDEVTVSVVYCKYDWCLDELGGFYNTDLNILTDIGIREVFGGKTVEITGEWLPGGDFYAHRILHTSTGVIREGTIDGFGGLRYFNYDIEEGDHSRRVSPVICDNSTCGGYPNAVLTDKQTDEIKAGKEITATGYEAPCIPVAPLTHCTEIGTATRISNPIVRGSGTIRQIDPIGPGAVSYVIDLDDGGVVSTYVCESSSCVEWLEDTLWGFYRTDFRVRTHIQGQPKAGDKIRYFGEKLSSAETYIHDVEVTEVATCDDQETAMNQAQSTLKSAEKAENSARKRLETAAKRAERRIGTILKIQKIRLKRKEGRKNKLEKQIPRLQTKCDNGDQRSCRKLDRKKKNLADITGKIEARKTKDNEKIARLGAEVDEFQKVYDEAVAAVDTAVKAVEDAETALDACNG